MLVGTYTGSADVGEVDGVQFPKDTPVEVNQKLASRLRALPDYDVERINQEQAETAGVVPTEEALSPEVAAQAETEGDSKKEVKDGNGTV